MGDSPKRSSNAAFLKFASMAYQMGISIGLGVWLGLKADEAWMPEQHLFTVLGALLGTGIALYVVIKESQK